MTKQSKIKGLLLIAALCSGPAGTVTAQESESLFGLDTASVTYGRYVRAELGGAKPGFDDANWLPPGGSDPRVFFDLDGDTVGFAAVAYGFDWQNGFRGDIALMGFGSADFSGTWSRTEPASAGPHATITGGSVRSTALMANVFYSPLEQRGNANRLQPFVVAGLGLANNRVSDWTRENAASAQPVRSFEGASGTDLAWSIGLGASYQVTRAGRQPILVEAAWRYYDLGKAEGGATPLPGSGSSEPQEPLQFQNTQSVITLGIRIPLQRF